MGYEVRMIVANVYKDDSDGVGMMKHKGCSYAHIEADLQLGKLAYDGAYHSLIDRIRDEENRLYYFCARDIDEEEIRVTEDRYGEPLLRLEIPDVIEALRAEVEEWPCYVPIKAALALLEQYDQNEHHFAAINDQIVIHYGY